ncbi:MAG: PRC-barrel domain-containing protein [Candidatus Thorarchaeota archaeon]
MPYQCCGIRFSQLMNKKVIDSSNKEAGQVNDFIITFAENKVALKSIVLGGGRIEEFMESIGLKPDIDPVFQMDCISQITEDVVLITDVESLKTTLDEGTITEHDMRLSEFSKLPIIDSDGMKVGRAIDIWFDLDGAPWLVASGGSFEEFLEKIGIQPDLDLLIPMPFIQHITKNEIKLKYTKFQLEGKCEDDYERYKRELKSTHEPGDARYASLKFNPRPQGLL